VTGHHIPVLVGAGTATRREDDYTKALEPLDLMIEAVEAAGADCGKPGLLREVERIAVPRGRWRYRNPAGAIAQAIGAERAQTVLSTVGVLQQSLIASACDDIANGKIDSAIIAGADAGYRILRAKISGNYAAEREQDDEPDVLLQPADELRHKAEVAAGMQMPVGLYALSESARRAAAGQSIQEHRAHLAQMYARFSAIASQNPDAWLREEKLASEISEAGKHNPMQAFPYTRSHCSSWNVDQAAALLLCSEDKADALGIGEAQRIFPVASAESSHMVPLSARADFDRCIGAELAADALYRETGIAPDGIDLIELYSCFPVAVECFAYAARIPSNRDLTITGGMAFAGGPYNNYFFQATAKAVQLLKAGAGRNALLSCVSGIMTKQAFALWSADRPENGFSRIDVTDEVAAVSDEIEVEIDFEGAGRVAGCTVIYSRRDDPYAVLLIDTDGGKRALITSSDAAIIQSIENEEWVGRNVKAVGGRLAA
jgi:acetyl-CoA C-acetyltransferase